MVPWPFCAALALLAVICDHHRLPVYTGAKLRKRRRDAGRATRPSADDGRLVAGGAGRRIGEGVGTKHGPARAERSGF
jgi:hypothetical protein